MATHYFSAAPFSTVYEDQMPLLFCNIGWMRDYNGIDGDSIHRGGSYNKHADGHEVCNFSDVNGKVFGYVQSPGKISLEKLGAAKTDKSIDGVTVIWTAGPDDGGTAVVGWYLKATVFREPQEFKNQSTLQKENSLTHYRISAASEDAILLPPEKRLLDIPRGVKGGIGQSNVWFAASPESKQIVAKVLQQIASTHNPQKITDVDNLAHGLEGNSKLVAHVRRERDSSLVKKKKLSALEKTGALACEACGFDFSAVYGKHGSDFCEVHHLRPLSEADGERKTSLSDLAIVCSNCHRIIHRIIPMPTIAEMKSIIQKNNLLEQL